jgi:hypothetical protein
MKPDELQCAAFCASRCTLEFLFYLKQKHVFYQAPVCDKGNAVAE